MRKYPFVLSLILVLVFASVFTVHADTDPLITLSYIDGTFLPSVNKTIQSDVSSAVKSARSEAMAELDAVQKDGLASVSSGVVTDRISDAVLKKILASNGTSAPSKSFTDIRLFEGDVLKGRTGTGYVLKLGASKLYGGTSGGFVNITDGSAASAGEQLKINKYYMSAADNGSGVISTDDASLISVCGPYTLTRVYNAKYEHIADKLKSLGLFLGTNYGFELERPATRIEALVMLIRLLGEERAALATTASCPFKDVPDWAEKYAAYAFSKGYTNGRSASVFDPSSRVSADEYFTFVLRSLGYSDSAGDFSWDAAVSFAPSTGLITSSERKIIESSVFRRDNVVYVSRNALFTYLKGSSVSLADRLIQSGAITSSAWKAASAALQN